MHGTYRKSGEQESTVTASDWATSTDPQAMLSLLLKRGASERKVRLFAVALAREVADPPFDPVLTMALSAAERLADDRLSQVEEDRVRDQLNATARRLDAELGHARGWPKDILATWLLVTSAFHPAPYIRRLWEPGGMLYLVISGPTQPRQPQLFRELFGNPFRPASFSPEWRTESVVALARGIDQERAFERMSVLADALEDAGCAVPDVLEHCRAAGPHWKGCWVVDLVLGKE
jgi:hypothetical protein